MVGCSPDGEVMLWAAVASELMHRSSSCPDSQQVVATAVCQANGSAAALVFLVSRCGEAPDVAAGLIPASHGKPDPATGWRAKMMLSWVLPAHLYRHPALPIMFYFSFILLLPLVTTAQSSNTLRGHSRRAKA